MSSKTKVTKKNVRTEKSASRRVRKPGYKKAEKIAQLEGQKGIDTRVAQSADKPGLERMRVSTVDATIDQIVEQGPRSIEHLAMGVILAALKRGWISNLQPSQSNYVYAAYVYLVQSFYSAMAGTVPTLQSAPRWYWILTQALMPTTARFKTSYITYKWNLTDQISQQPPPTERLEQVVISFGIPDPSAPTINGFFQLNTPTYTSDEGTAAIKSLFEYWNGEGFTKMEPYSEKVTCHDISAFAALYPELGSSPGSFGAMATTLYCERVIPMPLLSKLALYQDQNYRGWAYCGRSSGTPGYVVPRLTELKSDRQLYNKIPPIFKFVDFDEFFEVLSLTLGLALERAAVSNAAQPIGPCPLSPQAVQILLRQAIISGFNNEMAQDLVQNAVGSETYFPFSVGSNGVAITASNTVMKLPSLLAENIRACSRVTVDMKAGALDFVPILARRNEPQLGNYKWSGGSVYTDNPEEVPINLLDMSYLDGSTLKFISANGPQYTLIASIFNEWITTLGTFLSPLTTPAQAIGPPALNVLSMTRQLKLQVTDPVVAVSSKKPIAARQTSRKDLGFAYQSKNRVGQVEPDQGGSAIFKNIGILGVTATNTPLTPLWKYHRVMVLPSFTAVGFFSGGTIPYRQVFQTEPFRLPMGNTPDSLYLTGAPDLFTLHHEMAQLDVRTSLAPDSEVEQDLMALNAHGQGGFFTQLAGMFAEDVLGLQGARGVADTIGKITGL